MDSGVLQRILDALDNETKPTQSASLRPAPAAAGLIPAPGGSITEYVGCAAGDTVGIVIANLDAVLRNKMGITEQYRSIGIISSRVGSTPQLMAADEAVKSTNTSIISVEFSRDYKGGAGQGCTVVFAAADVSDARNAVEIVLSCLERCFSNVWCCDAGHIETHYTARASEALGKAFGAPEGMALGVTVGAPAAIGLLMADVAVKTADVNIVSYQSPANGNCYSNEIIIAFSGDSAAVRQAVDAAGETGLEVLRNMGHTPAHIFKA